MDAYNLGDNSFQNSPKYKPIDKNTVRNLQNKSLMDIFNAANTNGDDTLDSGEISLFLGKSYNLDEIYPGLSVETLTEFLELTEETQEIQDSTYVNTDSKNDTKDKTIEFIQSEYINGMQTLEGYDQGLISKGYDAIKEFLGARLTKSNVARVLYVKNETAELLRRAKNNELTEEEYYGKLKDVLYEIFPRISEMSEDRKKIIKRNIDTLSPEQVVKLQHKVTTIPTEPYSVFRDKMMQFLDEFKRLTSNLHEDSVEIVQDVTSLKRKNTYYTVNEPHKLQNPEKLVTFEEVFERQYSTKYDPENMENLCNQKERYLFDNHNFQRAKQIHGLLDSEIALNKGNNQHGATKEVDNISKDRLNNALLKVLSELGAKTNEEKIELIRNMTGFEIVIDENNKIQYSQNEIFVRAMTSLDLTNIADKFLEYIDNRTVSEETLQNSSKDLRQAYIDTFGKKSTDELVQSYINDQEEAVAQVRDVVEQSALTGMVVGLFVCPPLAFVSGIVGTVGGVGVEALNETGKKEITKERKDELIKELVTNSALFVAGMGAGKAGMSAKAMLISRQCPRLIACIADIGLDSTLSLLADLSLTGKINLAGEGFSQLLSLAAGHIKPKKISTQDKTLQNNPLFDNAVDHLAKTNPDLYAKFQYLRSKNMLPASNDGLKSVILNPKNAQFSDRYLKDLELLADAVKSGKNPIEVFIPKFDDISSALKARQDGEVFSLRGSNDVYIKHPNGDAVKLDMDRETYHKLFPPLTNTKTQQGAIGDCYFITGVIDAAMSNPALKVDILKLFHQNGSKISIDMRTYSASANLIHNNPELSKYIQQLPTKYEFDLEKPVSSFIYSNGVVGAPGLKLLEVAFGYNRLIDSIATDISAGRYGTEEIENFISELNKLLADPNYKTNEQFLSVVMGSADINIKNSKELKFINERIKKYGFDYTAFKHLSSGNAENTLSSILKLSASAQTRVAEMTDLNFIAEQLKNKNIIVYTSTYDEIDPKGFFSGKISYVRRRKKSVGENHAYRIESVDVKKQTVSIVNPWDTSKIVTISLKDFSKYFDSVRLLDITKTRDLFQNKYLLSKLQSNGLPIKNPQGDFYSDKDMMVEYINHIKNNNNIEYAETYRFKHPERSWEAYNKDVELFSADPEIQKLQKKYDDVMGNGGNNIAEILAGFKDGTDLVAIRKSMSRYLDRIKDSDIGYYTELQVLMTKKPEIDYIFTLEKAPEIMKKLTAKGISEDAIVYLLQKLTKSNYNQLKTIWED